MAETTPAAESQILCEGCEEGMAVLFCCQCAHLICDECGKIHRRLKVYRSHKIITLAELGGEHARRPPPTCATHSDSPMTRFCRGCDVLFCHRCAGHESHKVKAVDQYAPVARKEMEEVVKKVAEKAGELENARSVVQATLQAVEHQRDDLSQAIAESFEAAHRLLKEREEALMGEVALIAERKTKALHEQTERLRKVFESLNKLVSSTNQQIKKASNESLVKMSKTTLEELGKSLKESEQLHTMPDAVADLNFSPPTIHPHLLGAVHCNNEPALLTEVPKMAVVSESSEILLRIPQSGDIPSPGNVQVKLASLAHPDKVTRAEICLHSEETGIYRAVFVPQVRGRHTLTITANGKPIGEKPFKVFVNYRLKDLDKPIRTFAGFSGLSGITLNPKGELVVVEGRGNQLTVLNCKSWTRLRTITCKGMSNPTGVAVTKDGTIFVCQPHCLLRFYDNGWYWGTIGRQGQNPLEFNSPSSVRAIGDEVYVCDTGNGRVQVLNSNGEFLRAFFTRDVGNPQDIASGEDGLYLAGNNHICLYNQEGALIRKAQITGRPVQNSTVQPRDLYITDTQSIYVDSSGNIFVTVDSSYYGGGNVFMTVHSSYYGVDGGVYVFKPTGEYITRFGTHMTGMVIDEDGFVYVCGDGEVCVL